MAAKTSWTLSLLALLLVLPACAARAQATSALHPGDTVRIQRWAPALPVEGTLRELTPTHLAVEPGESGRTVVIRREDALRIHVRGTRRPWLKGAAVGALIGGAGLALAGLSEGDDHCSGWCFMTFSAEEKAMMGLVAGGILGGATGLVVGALTKTRVWRPVPREKVWIAPVVSSDGGLGLTIRLPSR